MPRKKATKRPSPGKAARRAVRRKAGKLRPTPTPAPRPSEVSAMASTPVPAPAPTQEPATTTPEQAEAAPAQAAPAQPSTPAKEEVGRVTHFYPKILVAVVELKLPLAVGDRIQIVGRTTHLEQVVESMQNEHKEITGASLRAMRAACRKFLDAVGGEDSEIALHAREPGHYASWTFYSALGEMRGVFGVHLAKIAVRFRLDVEDDLAVILPSNEEKN